MMQRKHKLAAGIHKQAFKGRTMGNNVSNRNNFYQKKGSINWPQEKRSITWPNGLDMLHFDSKKKASPRISTFLFE